NDTQRFQEEGGEEYLQQLQVVWCHLDDFQKIAPEDMEAVAELHSIFNSSSGPPEVPIRFAALMAKYAEKAAVSMKGPS
ncbi:MAG: hypothetical protein ACOYMV_14660, partial [Verrucomicrobiia bacterium]